MAVPGWGDFKRKVRKFRWHDWVKLVVLTIFPLAVGIVLAVIFKPDVYNNKTVIKPSWAPPGWLFAVCLPVLYLLIGFSSYLLIRSGEGDFVHITPEVIVYAVQLIVSFAWTPMFFGKGYFAAALLDIGACWALALCCCITFCRHSILASILFIPYCIWLTFTAALNCDLVVRNGGYVEV